MQILHVEDDVLTAEVVSLMLKSNGINVTTAHTGQEGVELAETYDYSLILLDLNLPDISGLNVLRRVRASSTVPIMFLSGVADAETKARALAQGADDYMTKPFHRDELVERIRAVVRRAAGHATQVLRFGRLSIDLAGRVARVDDRPIHMTDKEYGVLEVLALRKGATLPKHAILDALYGGIDEPAEKIIDVFVCKVRKRLADATGGDEFIHTVWGRGYALIAPQPIEQLAAQ